MAYDVLIVDDSETMRALVKKSLMLSGLSLREIREAEDGQAAIAVLREAWVDVVLADVHMPNMTGLELLEAMRADECLKDVPVIIVSSDTNPAHHEQLKRLGAKAFLRKPFRPEQLRRTLLEVLGQGEDKP
jgi:two-component system, chemotaxis family, chemotaxis protein CheY